MKQITKLKMIGAMACMLGLFTGCQRSEAPVTSQGAIETNKARAQTTTTAETNKMTAQTDNKLNDGVYAEIDTVKGKILLQLEYEKTPLTVANFVGLAEGTKHYDPTGNSPKAQNKPFYDGLTFHRCIPGFMIQGGDPQGVGSGGPGYRFQDEIDPSLRHDRAGILSMANAGPGTNGSQFFITHGPTPHLNGKHTVFGHVVQGQDIVMRISNGDKINSVKILRVGDKAKAFKGDQADFEKFSKKA
jgi:cyclophilin family peptidyl-prolyl cis-trans isomerase